MKKTVLITGIDTNLIAKSICISLFENDYEIIGTFESNSDDYKEDVAKFKADHTEFNQVKFEPVDFCSAKSLTSLISSLSNQHYDIIINCSTTLAALPDGSLRDESVDFDYLEFNRVMQYNVSAVAAICLGLKDQIKSGGTIINVTTSAAQEGAFATISYNASKAAVENLTKSLAHTLGTSKGIRVNSIAPGWIPPKSDVAAEGVVALANSLTPSLVNGKSDDVVAAVHYLINSSFQNGTIMAIDGGITSSYLPYMLESLQLQGAPIDKTIETLISLISKGKDGLRSPE